MADLDRLEFIRARAERMSPIILGVMLVTAIEAFTGREPAALVDLLVCRGLTAREATKLVDLYEELTKWSMSA